MSELPQIALDHSNSLATEHLCSQQTQRKQQALGYYLTNYIYLDSLNFTSPHH